MRIGSGEFHSRYYSVAFDTMFIVDDAPNRLLGMSEVDRENILAERQEQMQKIQDRRKLQEMIKQQKNGSGDTDAVAKAAKRTDNVTIFKGAV